MDTALRTTAEYLKTRKQFGVTLNKFQALTFRAADMYVSLELARSIALWASMVQEAGGDVVQAADRARLQVSRAGRHIGKEAIQLHGGIGVTAEYSVGHYTSRLTAIDHLLGDGDWARPASPRTWPATRRSTRWARRTPEIEHCRPGRPPVRATTSRLAQSGVTVDAAAMSRVCRPTGRCGPAKSRRRSCTVFHAAAATSSAVSRTPSRPTLAASRPSRETISVFTNKGTRLRTRMPAAAPLDVERLGERPDGGLRRAVGRQRRLPVQRGRRAQVEQQRPLRPPQEREALAAAVHDAGDVDVDHPPVRLGVHAGERARGEHAGIVDQDVEPAVPAELAEHGAPLLCVPDVQGAVHGGGPAGRGVGGRRGVHVVEPHPPAAGQEELGGRAADTARGAADQDAAGHVRGRSRGTHYGRTGVR